MNTEQLESRLVPKASDAAQKNVEGFWSILLVFLRLGLTSFGGPIAHLGYFRNDLVLRRKWLSEESYADLVALCQFLPGPASSQVGFSLGVLRGNSIMGGIAAWIGFTMPSALVLFAFALGAAAFTGPLAQGFIHGLKLVAVAVVAQAIWGMARTLTPDRQRAAIALGAIMIVVFFDGAIAQMAAIALGAMAGLLLCRDQSIPAAGHISFPVTKIAGMIALGLFTALLIGVPMLVTITGNPDMALFDAFYRSGALVFGGGHVVLPLLQAETVATGWLSNEAFLAGYGLTQAVPGPLFTFAAYLGAVANTASTALNGAAIALIGVFLPGILLVYGMLPFWDAFRSRPNAQYAMRGANAAVVGILGAALYHPVWTSAVVSTRDFAFVIAGFLLLTVWKSAPWIVVILLAAAGTVSVII